MRNIVIVIACLTATAAFAGQSTITGPARVIDGDTVVVGTTHVRLKGVDAAERGTPLGEHAKAGDGGNRQRSIDASPSQTPPEPATLQ